VQYEQVGDVTFVHVEVVQWTPRVAHQFRADIDAAHALLGRPVYAIGVPEAPLQPKFLAAHGFQHCGAVMDLQGRIVPIFGRSLNGQPIRWWHHNQ
jgi:hypothetical protein